MNVSRTILVGVCALVIGVYAYTAHSGVAAGSPSAADDYYNLLVQGFRAGHLSLSKEIPAGLTQLADPYDPIENAPYRPAPYRMLDLSYYKGNLYLYFGVTPALVLFWPFASLTGHYLSERQAVVIFYAIGFLAGVGLLRALWQRYASEVSVWVLGACALALGLATGVLNLLPRATYNEVASGCGYMLAMLSLVGIWRALHVVSRKGWGWLGAASVAYGLAVGARPSLLIGAVILLVPVGRAWRERRPVGALLIAAVGPIAAIGLGLMLYNGLRFGSPFEFGLQYQLTSVPQVGRGLFHLRCLWFNFRVYFLEPVRWNAQFPFAHEIAAPQPPPGYAFIQSPFGILTNIPLVWLALAVPLAWRGRGESAARSLRWFATAVAVLFLACVLPLLFFESAIYRYEADFLPALVLLAVIGILGLERVLADQPAWRRAARWGWGVLLGFSVAFNLLASVERCGEAHNWHGTELAYVGQFENAIEEFKQALRLKPDFAEAHNNLGAALQWTGRSQEAVEQWEQAVRIKPDYADAHNNLGFALSQQGRLEEAIAHYEQALQIKPNYAEAHNNLGVALARQGHMQEAIKHWEQALRLRPDFAEVHYELGVALQDTGQTEQAMAQYKEALRLRPDYAEARNALTRLGAGQ